MDMFCVVGMLVNAVVIAGLGYIIIGGYIAECVRTNKEDKLAKIEKAAYDKRQDDHMKGLNRQFKNMIP